jgi:hypothetical protein
MRSLADGLPPELAAAVDPQWRKNEADYWSARESLLDGYRGRWVGFADGRVVAAGNSPVEVFHKAHEAAAHPFVTCVGNEDAPCQMRRSSFPYDAAYPAQADATRAYQNLSAYRIQVVLEADGWHVHYELKDPRLKGGGPHYVIDANTGAIVSKRYEQ